jgi:hypothetical protein
MKRLFITGIVFLLGLSALAAQSNPIIGYDKVPWGASLEDVKKAYPDYNFTEEDISQWDEDVMGAPRPIFRHFYTEPDGRVFRRNFFFYNDKLYRVTVSYDKTKVYESMFQSMIDVLAERYGTVPHKATYIYGNATLFNYSDELHIQVIAGGLGDPSVDYVNPKIEKQMGLDQVQF